LILRINPMFFYFFSKKLLISKKKCTIAKLTKIYKNEKLYINLARLINCIFKISEKKVVFFSFLFFRSLGLMIKPFSLPYPIPSLNLRSHIKSNQIDQIKWLNPTKLTIKAQKIWQITKLKHNPITKHNQKTIN
jgi:hypothetical protein